MQLFNFPGHISIKKLKIRCAFQGIIRVRTKLPSFLIHTENKSDTQFHTKTKKQMSHMWTSNIDAISQQCLNQLNIFSTESVNTG